MSNDYYQTQAEAAAAAVAAAHGHLEHLGYDHGALGEGDMGGEHGDDGDKPLTSRFRGVCWNKKNRRWQAAINSSGKYIYLGSFLEEEEAARMFDKAAVRLRGNRAKLNFALADYTDETGELLDDPRISAIITKAEGASAAGGKAARGNGTATGDYAGTAAAVGGAGLGLASQGGGNLGVPGLPGAPDLIGGKPRLTGAGGRGMASGSGAGMGLGRGAPAQPPGGFTVPANAFKGRAINPMDVPLPSGCTLEATVPGEDDAFGILYLEPGPQRHLGAVIWDGFASQDLGVFDTDRDARTACNSALRIVLQYKNQNALLLQSLAESMLPGGNERGSGSAIAAAAPPHRRPSSPSGFGLYQEPVGLDALAVHSASLETAALGPLAVLSTGPAGLGQHSFPAPASLTAAASHLKGPSSQGSGGGQRSYAELFSFLSNYPKGPSKGLGLGAALGGTGAGGEEDLASAAALAAAGNPDLAGLLAQMGGAGVPPGDVLPSLPSLPLMLGRVSDSGGAGPAASMLVAAAAAALPAVAPLHRQGEENDEDVEPCVKRPKLSPSRAAGSAAALALALPMAGGGGAGAGVPSEFNQMKSMSHVSVEEAIKRLGGGMKPHSKHLEAAGGRLGPEV